MNAPVLDFPPIEAPPLIEQPKPAAPVAVIEPKPAVPVSIKEAVLAQFKEAETNVRALAEKYRNVAYDVPTTKGMAEAKAARQDLRENGRFLVQRAEKSVKDDVNSLKKVMADEVERIVAIVKPVEDAVDAQIKAEEERKAQAKAKEAERVAAHEAGIAKIRAYVTYCREPGMTAERIAKGIEILSAVTFGPEWQEFAEKAKLAQAETLTGMRELHAVAVEREAAAAKAEQERIEREAEQARVAAENERKAAELAERERALQAQADELAERERMAAFEAARIKTLQERVAAIHARPLELEGASSWDIYEAIVLLEGMDVSEAAFAEFAPMAADARRLVLAALLAAKDAAEKVETEAADKAAEVQRANRVGRLGASIAVAHVEEAPAVEPPDDGARIVADEPADPAPAAAAAADVFVPEPVDPITALVDCRAALTTALELVQELVNDMDQAKDGGKRALSILSHVSALRTLGGI